MVVNRRYKMIKGVGLTVKKELERRGMNQKELCKMTGISESAMSKYLSYDKSLRMDVVAKIARALDMNIYQLLNMEEKEGTTYDICKTALLARSGSKLSNEEKRELINLIFGHE